MIILNDIYKFQNAIVEENLFSLTLKVKYDMKEYNDFREFCAGNFFQQTPISIKLDEKILKVIIESSSFNLGTIEYDEKEKIKHFNTTAEAKINFKKEKL